MVHVRKYGEQTLSFIVSGRLWRNSLIMQDAETETYWSHVTGEALLGKLKGHRLQTVPVVQTTWSRWVKDHPDTKVLKKDELLLSSQYESYFKDPERIGLFRVKWLKERMPGKTLVYGISDGLHAVAVSTERVEKEELVKISLGGEDAIVLKSEDGGVRAFLPKVGEKRLSFGKSSRKGSYADRETGSLWDLESGLCTEGELKGKRIEELSVTPVFWFAWSNFYPNTGVVD